MAEFPMTAWGVALILAPVAAAVEVLGLLRNCTIEIEPEEPAERSATATTIV